MSRDPAALPAADEPRVQAEVRRAALRQLVAGGPLAESVHIVLVTVVAAVVWNSQPVGLTLGWVGAVAAAAGLRSWWRLRATKRVLSAEEALRGVRLTVAGVGLAWGFGAAAAIPALGLDEAALILVVLAGLVAGAIHPGIGPSTRLPRCADREHAGGYRRAGRPARGAQRKPGVRRPVRVLRGRGRGRRDRRVDRAGGLALRVERVGDAGSAGGSRVRGA